MILLPLVSLLTLILLTACPLDQPGELQFSSAAYSVNEIGVIVTISVTRSGSSFGAVGVSYASDDGTAVAEADADYTATAGSLSWGDGDTSSRSFNVSISEDNISESDETFTVTLSNPTGGARLGSLPSTTVTIIDNDPLPVGGTLQFSSATYSVYEHLLSVDISVTRSGSYDGEAAVTFLTAGGTAVVGPDYFSANGTLTRGNGDTSNRSFTVTLVYDPIEEGG